MFQSNVIADGAAPTTPGAFRQYMLRETGQGYAKFRKTLTPHYARVLADIGLGYAALGGWLVLVAQASGVVAGLAAACAGAVGVGFVVAYLQLFIHEAAHHNLAATKRRNDRIADWLLSWQVGTSIAAYRATHSEHHRYLGHDRDTEISYRNPLTFRFLAEMLIGLHALRVFRSRKARAKVATPARSRMPMLRGLGIHALLLGTMLAFGAWPAALAWTGGIAILYPFFATLRQVLEHRPTPGMVDDGASVTRLFGDGPFARIFGGAGFNRHLLHHLEPQLSYTRLGDLDAYLATTSIGPVLDTRRANYLGTLGQLLRERRA